MTTETMTTDQQYFIDVTHRIAGVKAQIANPANLVTKEFGNREIARLTEVMVDVKSRLTKDEVKACKASMKAWAAACSVKPK